MKALQPNVVSAMLKSFSATCLKGEYVFEPIKDFQLIDFPSRISGIGRTIQSRLDPNIEPIGAYGAIRRRLVRHDDQGVDGS